MGPQVRLSAVSLRFSWWHRLVLEAFIMGSLGSPTLMHTSCPALSIHDDVTISPSRLNATLTRFFGRGMWASTVGCSGSRLFPARDMVSHGVQAGRARICFLDHSCSRWWPESSLWVSVILLATFRYLQGEQVGRKRATVFLKEVLHVASIPGAPSVPEKPNGPAHTQGRDFQGPCMPGGS